MLVEDPAHGRQVGRLVPALARPDPLEIALQLRDERRVVVPAVRREDAGVGRQGHRAVQAQDLERAVVLAALVDHAVAVLAEEAARLLDVLPVHDPHLRELDPAAVQPRDLGFEERDGAERPAAAGVVLRRRRLVPGPRERVRARGHPDLRPVQPQRELGLLPRGRRGRVAGVGRGEQRGEMRRAGRAGRLDLLEDRVLRLLTIDGLLGRGAGDPAEQADRAERREKGAVHGRPFWLALKGGARIAPA